MKSLPRNSIDAIVFHRRLLIDSLLLDPNATANYCVECTILQSGKETITKELFEVAYVAGYLTKWKTNTVISQLQPGANQSLSQIASYATSQGPQQPV